MEIPVLDLKETLILFAKKFLPARSGQHKIFEIIIKMTKESAKEKMYAKVVFWHPNNYMMVAYDFEAAIKNFEGHSFKVAANHDSTWEHDAFSFLEKIMIAPEKASIYSFGIVDVVDAYVYEDMGTFHFTKK